MTGGRVASKMPLSIYPESRLQRSGGGSGEDSSGCARFPSDRRFARGHLDGCQILPIFSAMLRIDSRHGAVVNPLAIFAPRVELWRWQPPLFTLFRTTISTTGWCATTIGTSLATIPPEKSPNRPPRRSRESAGTNSSFISLTEEPAARILQRGGRLDSSGDDQAEAGDALSHLDAVGMLPGPRQQLSQRHHPRLACNLPAVMHQNQRRYALDGEALQQFRYRIAVHLDQPHVGLELGCRLFEDRRHCPARTAPKSTSSGMSLCFACLSNRATLSSAAGHPS